jgi:hypothetical protein
MTSTGVAILTGMIVISTGTATEIGTVIMTASAGKLSLSGLPALLA